MVSTQRAADEGDFAVGNAAESGRAGGWFVGPFLERAGIRRTDRVELKWGVHRAGERRDGISDGAGVGSAAVLVTGSFVMEFPTKRRHVLLSRCGDYVLYGPGVAHSWHAVTDSTVLTVRWPADG
ncbi:signal peptidase I [Polymorphospora sp. NPDC050346]|uniref:signal peptidase I n=1 Tax=Polymorphospora sp. NPDC050346 TaxID=3155780 RepID=UPI003407C8C2